MLIAADEDVHPQWALKKIIGSPDGPIELHRATELPFSARGAGVSLDLTRLLAGI